MFVCATERKLFHVLERAWWNCNDYQTHIDSHCGFSFLFGDINILFNSQDDTEAYIEQHVGMRMCKCCVKHLRKE